MRTFGRRLLEFLKRQSPVHIAVGLGALYFLIQLAFIHRYGVTWDEPHHRMWGKLFAEYVRTGDRRSLLQILGHGLYYSPLYFFAEYLTSKWIFATGLLTFVASNHVLNLLTASVGVGTLFVFATLVGGRVLGLLSVLFIVFFPPFIAHSHYNPKDIPLMTALLLTGTVFLSGLFGQRRWRIVLSGAMLGACIALKVSAVLMVPVFLLTYAVSCFDARDRHAPTTAFFKKELLTLAYCVLAVLIGLVIAWPSAWTDPALIPRAFWFFFRGDFWTGSILFLGQTYKAVNLPFYYSPLEFFLVTPLLTAIFAAIGVWTGVRLLRSSHHRTVFTLLFLWILIPLIASCKTGVARYDGMRQYFFCLPPVAVFAALGCRETFAFLKRRFGFGMWLPPLFAFLIAGSFAYEIALIHPYEGAYRNEVARWLIPHDMDRKLEVEYWGEIYIDGVAWLNDHADAGSRVCVPIGDFLIEWYPLRSDLKVECSLKSTYAMYFTRYAAVEAEDRPMAALSIPPVYTISRYHSTLLKIFKLR